MNNKTITKHIDGYVVDFRPKENGKYILNVVGNDEMTQKILDSFKQKTVKADRLYFYIKAVKEKIREFDAVKPTRTEEPKYNNPIVELCEKVQKRFGANIETEVVKVTGKAHCPTVEVKVTLPNGETVRAIGDNQKIAKQTACSDILENWKNHFNNIKK